jgi:hypothetical protein
MKGAPSGVTNQAARELSGSLRFEKGSPVPQFNAALRLKTPCCQIASPLTAACRINRDRKNHRLPNSFVEEPETAFSATRRYV